MNTANRSLGRSAVESSVWTVVGFGATQAIRMISNIILAALLFEEAFALMAIVLAVSQGLAMFSDLGLGPNITQSRKGDDRRFLDNAWTLQIIRGVLMAAILIAISTPVAEFYAVNDPNALELTGLLTVIALSTFIQSFQSTKIHTASRHMSIGRVTILQTIAQIVGILVSVLLAWQLRSVYALAYGSLASAILTSLLSHIALPGENNRLRWDTALVLEIVHFGKWIFLSTAITFMAMQLDKLLFSRLFPLDQVGVYAIAVNVSILAPLLMGRLVFAVAFPLFSKVLQSGKTIERSVNRAKHYLLGIGAYFTAGLVGCGHLFINAAYDERYTAAGLYLPILAIGSWFLVIENINGAALLASGKANWTAATNATKVVALCLIVYPMTMLWGMIGAVVTVALAECVKMLVAIIGVRSIGIYSVALELKYTVYWIATVALTLVVSHFANIYFEIHPIARLLLGITLTTIAFIPVLFNALSSYRSSLYESEKA